MTLSLFKEDFPWIYEMGKELIDILKTQKDSEEKSRAIKDFREMIDLTCSHPIMRDMFDRNKDTMILLKEMPYFLMRYLDDLTEQYVQ